MTAAQNSDIVDRMNRILSGADERSLDETECRAIRDAVTEIERLRAERDEARRLYCVAVLDAHPEIYRRVNRQSVKVTLPEEIAEMKNWDCYKENTND